MNNKEQIILKHDDRLLKNETSWRRARIGALILFVVFLIIILTVMRENLISKEERTEALTSVIMGSVFWLLIIDWLTLRLRHIDSINLYRRISKSEQSKHQPQEPLGSREEGEC